MPAGGDHAFATPILVALAAALLAAAPSVPGVAEAGELACLARTDRGTASAPRRTCRRVGHRAEHRLEAPDARVVGVHAHRLARTASSSTWRSNDDNIELWCLDPRHGTTDLAAAPERWEPPAPQAEHVVAVPGHGRRARLGDDRHRHPQGVRCRRQRAVDARHSGVVRPVRAELGLCLVAVVARRSAVRAGAARHAGRTTRPTSCGSTRSPARPSGGSSGPSLAGPRVAGRVLDRPALLEYDGTTEIVITGGDAVTGHDPETGQELWRADGLKPHAAAGLPHRGLAARTRRGDLRPRRGSGRCWRLRPGGRGDVLDTHVVWSTDNGPDVPTPVTDGEYFLRRQRPRHRVRDRREDGRAGLRPRAHSPGDLQRVAGAGRREDLRHQRERHDPPSCGRDPSSRCWRRTTSTTTCSVRRPCPTGRSSSGPPATCTPSGSAGRRLPRPKSSRQGWPRRRKSRIADVDGAEGRDPVEGEREPPPAPGEQVSIRLTVVAGAAVVLAALVVAGWRRRARRR